MEIEKYLKRIKDLPPMPDIVLQINRLVKDSSSSVDDVADVIEKDAALASRVLRLANSSYYGLASQVDSISRAIVVLGFNAVCNLVTAISVSGLFSSKKEGVIDMAGLWKHSLGCAIASKKIMEKKNQIESEKAFVSGILHDIGKVLIAQSAQDEMIRILSLINETTEKTELDAEKEILGFTHSELGFEMAKKWRFPENLLEAIRFHHQPVKAKEFPDLVAAVYLGNSIAKAMSLGNSTEKRVLPIETSTWVLLDISEKDIARIVPEIQEEYDMAMTSWAEV